MTPWAPDRTSLTAAGVAKSFGPHPVLRGVDLHVPESALVAILGPSGSGKTTFLRIVAGFERLDAGSLAFGDTVVDDGRRYLPPEARSIGYVPQEGALFPHLTVRRNVGFGLTRATRRDGRIEELLELVGLAGYGRRYPHEMSGGQQQRVALARALAIRPSIVLLDEPFASLDAALRASVRADVEHVLRRAGATTVLVTHDQDEALSFADKVAVLRDGRIVQFDTPADLYKAPADAGVASFVGQANLLPGRVADGTVACALGALRLAGGRGLRAGAAVQVLVRPEQLRIGAHDVGYAGDVGAPGVVTHQEYYGHDALVWVRLGDGAAAERAPRDEVVVRTEGSVAPSLGARVRVLVVGSVLAWPDATTTQGADA